MCGYSPERRSPNKSASPTVEDINIDKNVSVLANKPKPLTPYVQSSGDLGERLYSGPMYQIPGTGMYKASPIELREGSEVQVEAAL